MTYKAFVSSTFEDLKGHRQHVIAALRKAGFSVDPMEDWTASTDEPKQFSEARVRGCNLCVLLVGFRRGHIPKGKKFSITQLEYQAAMRLGIDVLVFMLDKDAPWWDKFNELKKDPQIERWRTDLGEHKGVGFFGLEPKSIEIAPALTRWLAESSLHTEARIIKLVNKTAGKIDDEEIQFAIRAINHQLADDFNPNWNIGAKLLLHENSERRSRARPDRMGQLADAVIYLYSGVGLKDVLNCHDTEYLGIPWGFVDIQLSHLLNESWTTTLSREVLQVIVDPDATRLVPGPHPIDQKIQVHYWQEICDAVQSETYEVDEVSVANFALPSYYSWRAKSADKHDFLGRPYGKMGRLQPFGVKPGGFTRFFNPATGKQETFCLKGDGAAARRLSIQARLYGQLRGRQRAAPDSHTVD